MINKNNILNKIKLSIKNNILTLNFDGNISLMNNLLDPISNIYEGKLDRRIGHNFPSEFIPEKHILSKFKFKCKYVIGIAYLKDLAHELAHAKFYLDINYKNNIIKEWYDLDSNIRDHIYNFLKKLGYSDQVIIDEYQAYRYTESKNFFGIKF